MTSFAVSFRRQAARLALAFLAVTAALPQTLRSVEAAEARGAAVRVPIATRNDGRVQSAALVNGEFRLRHLRPMLRPGASLRAATRDVRSRVPCSATDICSETIFQDGFEPPCVALPSGCGGVEICGNGTDDDCNGEVDDGCSCQPGAQQACFSGMPGQRNIGVCADGTQTCIGSEFGAWGPCVGGVTPSTEVCDGLDNDCNGCVEE